MRIGEFFRNLRARFPWMTGWRAYNGTENVASMSGETLAEWLNRSGKRRGVWSEITYFTCMKIGRAHV